MAQHEFSDFSSDNARINVRLENFHFFHRPISPEGEEATDGKYMEQRNATHQLYNWIHHNDADSGTYLVTGYRGAGKSSFVGTLVRKLKTEGDYLSLSVNFGLENIEELEILRIITKRLHCLLLEQFGEKYESYKEGMHWKHFLLTFSLISLSFFIFHLKEGWNNIYSIPCTLSFLLYIIISVLEPSGLIQAVRKLEELKERLHASVQTETVREMGMEGSPILKILGIRSRTSRSKAPATIQEIEYDLIEILDLLKKAVPKRKIIIIFDELDKTDSSGKRTRPDEFPEFEKLSVRPGQKTSSRSRKEEVLRIIAGMKFFLSSAKACFIFIAGREMYEAFQADMSDRDFSINSIFTGVININSFLTSTRNANSSTQNTEEFVCRQLLPDGFERIVTDFRNSRYDSQNPYTLKNYYNYILTRRADFHEDEITADGKPDRVARQRRLWRDVMVLYHFINYLTYISNGSPKKLTLFFEKNIRKGKYLVQEKNMDTVRYYRNGKLQPAERGEMEAFYLSFSYHTQMKINFVHYLTYPIMQSLINRSSLYGDKLLVAASFLISHLFKLHNCGFSWRNLEQVPELLEINKTPEIREYIGSIIDFMNHTHLTTIPFGLYHYKFPMRIAEEISFHSKQSGEVSAIFNFSQDDIRGIKEHYLHLLGNNSRENDATRYAQASVRHTLGDLCMMEENYSNAIFEYEKSLEIILPLVEELKKGNDNIHGLNYIAFLNRTMLKLGLAHEKRRTDNSAFILYTELLQTLLSMSGKINILFDNVRTMHLPLLARLYALEKINVTGIRKKDLDETWEIFKKLFNSQNGDNKAVEADFHRKLGDILYYKNCRFGGLVYDVYSAKRCYWKSMCLLLDSGIHSCQDDNMVCFRFCTDALHIKRELEEHSVPAVSSGVYRDNLIYHIALCLEDLGHVAVSEYEGPYAPNGSFLEKFSDAVKNSRTKLDFLPRNNMERAMMYYWTASRLYNISCERGLSTICYREMAYVMLTFLRNTGKNCKVDPNMALTLYRNLTEHFFISQYRQYEHIHLSESDILQWMQNLEMFRNISLPDLSVFPDMEEMIYTYYTFRLCLYQRLREEKTEVGMEMVESLQMFYTSDVMSGKHPRCTLAATVQNLKLKSRFNEQLICNLLECNAEDLETLQLVDLTDYVNGSVKDPLVLKIFFRNGETELDAPDRLDTMLDLLEFLITDGMFCLSRVLELVTPLRNTTLFNNSFKADIYMHLVRFNALYRLLYCYYCYGYDKEDDRLIKAFLGNRERFRNIPRTPRGNIIRPLRPAGNFSARRVALFQKVKRVTRKINPTHTHVHFLAETAIHYYTKVRQTHYQGKSYQELIRNLFFLEDDLKNDTLQFYMAIERFEIASGVQHRIETRLKRMYSDNIAYQIDKYFQKIENLV